MYFEATICYKHKTSLPVQGAAALISALQTNPAWTLVKQFVWKKQVMPDLKKKTESTWVNQKWEFI